MNTLEQIYPSATNSPLTAEELAHLAEVREVLRTASTPGWQHILRQIRKFTDEAEQELLGAVYATPEVKAGMATRWQQRKAVLLGVIRYIQECESIKTQLLEEAKERSSNAEGANETP